MWQDEKDHGGVHACNDSRLTYHVLRLLALTAEQT